jgi:hypothetical protein
LGRLVIKFFKAENLLTTKKTYIVVKRPNHPNIARFKSKVCDGGIDRNPKWVNVDFFKIEDVDDL